MHLTIVGCGFVGLALARQLQDDRSQLTLTLTTTSEERLAELRPLAEQARICDATDAISLKQSLRDAEIAVFCLGPKGNSQVDEDGYRNTFVDSFHCLTDLLPQLPQLRQIIYTSSCSVYGDAQGAWVSESTPTNPSNGHGAVLVESESLLLAIDQPQRRVCILRLGALHGPGREFKDRFENLAGQTRPGRGQQFTNWVHVDDVAGAIRAAMTEMWCGVINVVNDQPIRLAELIDRTLSSEGLEPIQWSNGSKTTSSGRRIRNTRLHALGYVLKHPKPTF
jgi:nucleoside-diphosphate-sugar epimerase